MGDSSRVRLNKDKLRLSGDGIFYTLQGEGTTMGLPAVFLRLHVCNLRCTWCDAFYTWDAGVEEFWTESYELSVTDVAERLLTCWSEGTNSLAHRVVITGGEPLLQKNLLDTLIEQLPGWVIEIETNGTIMPSDLQLRCCQFNCSPKLDNSGNSPRSRIRPDVLQAINGANSQFKFVVNSESDVEEVLRDYGALIDHQKIILMPQGISAKEVQENAQRVVEIAKRKGLRMLGRMQVDLWGAKRGV
jgi:organic radical activating enzyme